MIPSSWRVHVCCGCILPGSDRSGWCGLPGQRRSGQPGVIDQLSENVAFIHAPATDEFDVKRIAEGHAVRLGKPFLVVPLDVWSVTISLVFSGISDETYRIQTPEVFKPLYGLSQCPFHHHAPPRVSVQAGDRLVDSLYRLILDSN